MSTVSSQKQNDLRDRMHLLGVREEDIEEKFIRSQGRGGQKVNKTSTCVRLKHKPTGIEIKCQDSRSQNLNRFLARRRLVEKIELVKKGKESPLMRRYDKIKKQKAKRRRRTRKKLEILNCG